MYELRLALRYLLPRWRQLSVAIISLLSLLVIALIVWLIVVFFSVTHGLEKGWTQKLLSVSAPIRINPTADYFKSYYYRIDGLAGASDFSLKSLADKRSSTSVDPYDADNDMGLPATFPSPHTDDSGVLVDLVAELDSCIAKVSHRYALRACDYEVAPAEIELQKHSATASRGLSCQQDTASSTYPLLLTNLDEHNKALQRSIMPLEGEEEEKPLFDRLAEIRRQHPNAEPLLLPKNFADSGVKVGDSALVQWKAPTAATMQYMHVKGVVAGFYDPGILPLGGRFALIDGDVVAAARMQQQLDAIPDSNGVYLHLANLDHTEEIAALLQSELEQKGLSPYFHVENYREYPFAKDFLQQLRSERNLFSLISCIVIIVACSNIVSMLIILVNDKRQEIGILRSMGASVFSIAPSSASVASPWASLAAP